MHYYRATIQYDGTDFSGYQWQRETLTVQDEINQALERLLSGKITIAGASRTDAGVHAADQVIRITSDHPLAGEDFLARFNQQLPAQIRCTDLKPSSVEFNPTPTVSLKSIATSSPTRRG